MREQTSVTISTKTMRSMVLSAGNRPDLMVIELERAGLHPIAEFFKEQSDDREFKLNKALEEIRELEADLKTADAENANLQDTLQKASAAGEGYWED